MSKQLPVSVIVPVFNVKDYVAEAFESVLSQTHTNLELIVVDDGSTDGSGEICDDFASRDPRVKVIHQENSGISTARNTGLDHAHGEVIAFLDPDDAFCEDMIETLLETMQKDRSDIVMCKFSWHDTDSSLPKGRKARDIGKSTVITRTSAFGKIAEEKIETAVWNKLYRRKIFEDLRFPDGYVFEGRYTVFDIFERAERISVLDEVLVRHRRRQGSICHSYSLKNVLDREYVQDHYVEFIKQHAESFEDRSVIKRMIRLRMRSMVAVYLQYSRKNPEDTAGQSEIRRRLLELKKREGLRYSSLMERGGYYGVRFFPGGTARLYGVYKRLFSE